MSNWKQIIGKIAANAEDHFDKLNQQLHHTLNLHEGVHIVPYRGYGTPEKVIIRGRVLEEFKIGKAKEKNSLWRNLLDTYRRFDSDEIPHAPLQISFESMQVDIQTDREGYFNETIDLTAPIDRSQLTHTARISYTGSIEEEATTAEATVFIPPATAQFGVISDIDDTVLRTDVTNLLKLARNTFLRNARTRLPFAGVAAFYNALQRGTTATHNPIFYVSNSPWNLHDLLTDFFNLRKLPAGPLFLRDMGLSRDYIGADDSHKRDTVRHLMTLYPDLPFILIGDSGEKDAAIYRDVVVDYPDRVAAIYIRDVDPETTTSKRDRKVQAIAEELRERYGIPMLLMSDSLAAAKHALANGWIDQDGFEAVKEAQAQDTSSNPIEDLLNEMSSDG